MTQRFLVVYEHGKRNYSGFCPDILGCVSTGKTLEKMRIMMREALEGHLQWMFDDGDPIPTPTTMSVDFSVEDLSDDPEQYFVIEWLQIAMPTSRQVGQPERHALTA